MKGADDIDARLHGDRLDGRRKRLHSMPWRDVPAGAFVDLDGMPAWSATTTAAVVGERGYGASERPASRDGDAVVITPAASIVALRAGYTLS